MSVVALLEDVKNHGVFLYVQNEKLKYSAKEGGLTPEIKKKLTTNKLNLIEYLSSFDITTPESFLNHIEGADIQPVSSEQPQLLSFAQQRMWFLNKLMGPSGVYNIPMVLRFNQDLDVDSLTKTLQVIVDRHEILRTKFIDTGSLAQQQSQEWVIELPVENINDETQIQAQCAKEAQYPFDLENDRLMRARLFCSSNSGDYTLSLVFHHSIFDGWSQQILLGELEQCYEAISSGNTPSLTPLPIQYKDYAVWQRKVMKSERFTQQLDFWKAQLNDMPSLLELPCDRSRPSQQTFVGSSYQLSIPKALSDKLKQLSQDHSVSLFMTLQAVFAMLLNRYTNQNDIAVGTPIANRNKQELEKLMGFFVNTLVLRNQFSQDMTFIDFLGQTRDMVLASFDNQDIPFEMLVDELCPQRTISHSPLFQVMFVLQNAPSSESSRETALNRVSLNSDVLGVAAQDDLGLAHFDLTLGLTETKDGLKGEFEYNVDLFDETSIARLANHYITLLESVVSNPEQSISQLPILSDSERNEQLQQWNNTKCDFPPHISLAEQFQNIAQIRGSAEAISDGVRALSYEELNCFANYFANKLIDSGVQPDMPVGVCMNRSVDNVIAVLAIIKAGGYYVPLDPEYPSSRLRVLAQDSGVAHIMIDRQSKEALSELFSCAELHEIGPMKLNGRVNKSNPKIRSHGSSIAYLNYTSGSTGKPKGVLIEHANVSSLFASQSCICVEQDDVVAQVANYSFDAFTYEMWAPLLNGAKLVVIDKETLLETDLFAKKLADEKVTALFLTTALFNRIALDYPQCFSPLKKLLFGGEAYSKEAISAFFNAQLETALIHVYGPTECTTFTTASQLDKETFAKDGRAPIGRPLSNRHTYVVKNGDLLPVGAVGELLIGGQSVARGYLHNSKLNKEKFIESSLAGEGKQRLYRTGDLVRYLANGEIEFVGRVDQQVKIRGFRIELDEVSNVLRQHEQISDALVIVLESKSGHKMLISYLAAEHNHSANLHSDVLAFAKENLPSYMVPDHLILLDKLPLNENGKVDRKQLPAVDLQTHMSSEEIALPESKTECILHEIWTELLGQSDISIDDNFFAIGGDSILSIQVVSRAKANNIQLTVKQLFEYQTIRALAKVASASVRTFSQQKSVGKQELLPIQQWYLNSDSSALEHFHQSQLFSLPKEFDVTFVRQFAKACVERHDIFSLAFNLVDGHWNGEYQSLSIDTIDNLVEEVDLTGQSDAQRAALISEVGSLVKRNFDLSAGGLIRFVYFSSDNQEESRLLIGIHHLIVDGVSWRILTNDLQIAHSQWLNSKPIQLSSKTTSFQQWGEVLKEYGATDALNTQKSYWLKQLSPCTEGEAFTKISDTDTYDTAKTQVVELSQKQTQALLSETSTAYNTQTQDLLVTSLMQALYRWLGRSQMRISFESHGRAEIDESIDLSETIGWFTSVYPLKLSLTQSGSTISLPNSIKSIKERLRSVPDNGVGFGVLQHILKDADITERLTQITSPVVFNYLGQLEQKHDTRGFTFASEDHGEDIGIGHKRTHTLGINCAVVGGALKINVDYHEQDHSKTDISNFVAFLSASLQDVISHCQHQHTTSYTPSDFPLVNDLSQSDIDSLTSKYPALCQVYPTTEVQRGFIYHSLLEEQKGAYASQLHLDFDGKFEPEHFKSAWQSVVKRHDIFRTLFEGFEREESLQVVVDEACLTWIEEDWRQMSCSEQEAAFEEYRASDKSLGFDFHLAPLMRMSLIRLTDTRYRWLWTHHHSILDGWSVPVLFEELFDTYKANQQSAQYHGEQAPVFADYMAWLSKLDKESATNFWRQELEGIDAESNLQLGEEGPLLSEDATYIHEVSVPAEVTAKLTELANSVGVPLNIVIQAAWSILLSKYQNNSEVLFGQTVSGRPADIDGIEKMLGLCINTLPIKVAVPFNTQICDFLKLLHGRQVEREDNGYLPLSKIKALSGLAASGDLFDILLVVQNYPVGEMLDSFESADSNGLGFTIADIGSDVGTHYSLALVVAPGQQIELKFEFQPSKYSQSSIERLAQHLSMIFTAIADKKVSHIEDISLLEYSELATWDSMVAAGKHPFDHHLGLHQLLEQQAKKSPIETAVTDHKQSLSFAELNKNANIVAHHLISEGVSFGDKVAVCLEPTVDALVAFLAVLKTGAAYVPLDVSYPAARLSWLLSDCGASKVITSSAILDSNNVLSELTTVVLENTQLQSEKAFDDSFEIDPVVPHFMSTAVAYVIYTSGSTGKPKGVEVSHRNLVNYLQSATSYLHSDIEGAVVSSSLVFDATVCSLYLPLINGLPVEFVSQDENMLEALADYVMDDSEDLLFKITPSHLQALINLDLMGQQCESKHVFVVGGEAFNTALYRQWAQKLPNAVFINEYGPTEATVGCCVYAGDNGVQEDMHYLDVPIGKPLRNTELYVLDEQLNRLPVGVPGELYIGGEGVAQGYLNRAGLTGEKFIPNPFGKESGARLYKTGDLVRLLPQGNLQFLKRIDEQIKVRGKRIELGEISAEINALVWVNDAVVLVKEAQDKEPALIAFLQLDSQQFDKSKGDAQEQLNCALRKQLPAYMLPDLVVELEQIPLTINGKVDKRELLAMQVEQDRSDAYIAPRNDAEQKMAQLWCDVLKLPQVGIYDDFFALGGHSILATRLNSAIRAAFNIEISLKILFDYPTISELCAQIEQPSDAFVLPEIVRAERKPQMTMSYAQQRLWFIDQLAGGSAHYNMQGAYVLEGSYDERAFKLALTSLLERHEVLRTHFESAQNEAWQVIEENPALPFQEFDLSLLDEQERIQRVLTLFRQEGETSFDLNNELMLRVLLVKMDAQTQLVIFTVHHIACDGWSVNILQKELKAFYEAYREDTSVELEPLAIQYADYAQWQREWLKGEVLEQQQAYWREQLKELPQIHSLPLDFKRPVNQTFKGKMFKQVIPFSVIESLQEICKAHDVTLFMLMETVFALLLGRYSNEEDIVVGSAVAGRGHKDLEPLIGFFINSVALRTDLSGDPTFAQLLERNKQVVLDAYSHQHIPFEVLVEELRPERNLSYNPIFQIMFAVERHEASLGEKQRDPVLHSIEEFYATSSTTRSDLQVQVNIVGEQASVSWIYNESLFADSSIEQIADSYLALLESVLSQPAASDESVAGVNTKISQLNAVSAKQKSLLLGRAKGGELAPHCVNNIHRHFEQQAAKTPSNIAVQLAGDSLTYEELNSTANQLARCLLGLGITKGQVVGICLENSLEMFVAMLAVFKAGAGYAALDPALPTSRLEAMLEDCATQLVLTQQDLMAEIDFAQCKTLPMDEDVLPIFTSHLDDKNLCQSDVDCHGDDLAYVVFTSGSTGRPKGVKVSHRAMMVYLAGASDNYYTQSLDGALIATSYSVDMTIPSLFLPLLHGDKVVLSSAELSLEAIADYLNTCSENFLLRMTPSHVTGILSLLGVNKKLTNRHKFVIGGEALHYATIEQLSAVFPDSEVINHYGPSEAVVGCVTNSDLKVLAKDEFFGTVPIGKPMKETSVYVLDQRSELQIPGSVGELAIGGRGLSDGYINSSSTQKEKFISSRFSFVTDMSGQEHAETLYRTGDLVRWLPDGNLTFIGRVDDQVSIRGYRIELGDIDSKLKGIGDIKEATVVITNLHSQGESLVAYVVPTTEIEGEEDLEVHQEKARLIKYYREQLAQDLPNHMIPLIYVFLDRLPKTPNGKVNKAKLPLPSETDLHFESYVSPTSDVEKELCELWQTILKLEQVGIEDNFFSLGGHSLLATSLVSTLRQEHDIDIPVRMLFEFPTIKEFSSVVETQLLNKNMDTRYTEEFIL